MQYYKTSIKRIFTVRMDHGDNLIHGIEKLAVQEQIRSGFMILLGASEDISLVTGPKAPIIPPQVNVTDFNEVGEILGIGNIFLEDNLPKIHLHAAIGNGEDIKVGCIRDKAHTFMTVEILIIELDIGDTQRIKDETKGFSPITFPISENS